MGLTVQYDYQGVYFTFIPVAERENQQSEQRERPKGDKDTVTKTAYPTRNSESERPFRAIPKCLKSRLEGNHCGLCPEKDMNLGKEGLWSSEKLWSSAKILVCQ